jgi:hypothetical protein
MATTYAADAASARADIKDAGAAVAFTRNSGDPNYTITTITGYAIQARGLPDTYRLLSLVESSNPTLLFAADNYGDRPSVGDTIVWAGTTYTTKDTNLIAPDGVAIITRVIVGA